ncbi:PIG-L deacetylase family protein [Terriglobus roseus]|nr:PIG-L family deacetylase [Terriglobus roseus]
MLSKGIVGSIGAGSSILPMFAAEKNSPAFQRLKVLVAGGHPDDPESGCGGTIARYTEQGHEVVILYLTRGEAGIQGKSATEAAAIRTAESLKACEILKARPIFAGQLDGATELNSEQYDRIFKILQAERPSVLFTQWPIDRHRDHRAASQLVFDYWLKSGKSVDLFYYEVEAGMQTQNFYPTHYVDITSTESRKRQACFAHTSQLPETTWYRMHEEMHRIRGLEHGCRMAEAFIRHNQSPDTGLPGL